MIPSKDHLLSLILVAALVSPPLFAQGKAPIELSEDRVTARAHKGAAPAQGGARAVAKGMPRLVVLLVADQMRAETLARYQRLFAKGGFSRLLSDGAVAIGHYGQQNTYTGPGHALIVTGSYGYLSGITQNKFYSAKSGRSEAMMFDAAARVLGEKALPGPEDETSPRNLIGSTLGDELRRVSPESKVVSIALKGRGSILLGGHTGDAYFFSDETGQMTTSTYYMNELPAWARAFNRRRPADAFFKKVWERLLPEAEYAAPDDSPFEGDVKGLGRTFPHLVTGKLEAPGPAFYEALTHTPFGIDLEIDFAIAALDGEQLGQRGVTDILAVSISSTDLVGHTFGPDSQEYEDVVLRLDRALAGLLAQLDRRFRPGEVLVAFTADHGATSIPEALAEQKVQAARIKKETLRGAINKALSERFGQGEWVVALEDPSIYLDEKMIERSKAPRAEIEDTAGRALLGIPGIAAYLTRTQLRNGWLPPTEAARAMARSYHPARGGDLVLLTAPFHFWGKYGEKDQGSTHGSIYRYDTDVPLVLLGPWFTKGHHGVVEMVDLAATLSHLLRLTPPAACEGRPLMHMMRSAAAR